MVKKLTWLILLGIVPLESLPARASTFDLGTGDIVDIIETGEDIFTGANGDYETLLSNALDYVIDVLGAEFNNDCPEILRIVPGECPSGNSLEGILIEEVPKTSGGYRTTSIPGVEFFNTNPTVVERDFANLYDQELARAQAARFLGSTGSNWLDQNATTTSILVQQNEVLTEEVAELTKEAHTLEVTQDVMKNSVQVQSHLAQISLNQSKLNAQMQASLLSLQKQQANLMQLGANLGEALDESNRRERLELDTIYWQEGRSIIYIPGFSLE